MHTLFNCASWVGHQSTIWSLGGIKPSCNTPQGHNTSYTQPAPLAHTAIPLIQLFLIFKTQKHNSYFFFIFWPWGSHTPKVTGQGSHTQVLFGWGQEPRARKHNIKKHIQERQAANYCGLQGPCTCTILRQYKTPSPHSKSTELSKSPWLNLQHPQWPCCPHWPPAASLIFACTPP